MGRKSNGCGRRENYEYAPTSRMNNTYIAPGKSTVKEIIAATEYGLYAKSMGGGSVNPTTGEFNFAVTEGYMIRNEKAQNDTDKYFCFNTQAIESRCDFIQKLNELIDNISNITI